MYAKYTPIRVNFDLAPNLTPSDKKLGRAAQYVCVYFAFASDNYAERAKGAERVLLITNSPFGLSGLLGPLTPLQALL